jgi:hypothetical protein
MVFCAIKISIRFYFIKRASLTVVKVVDFKLLAPHRCGFESRQGLWILSCEESIQLVYRTSVVLLRFLFVPEIMHVRASEVFPTSKAGTLPYDLYCVGVT